MDTDIEKLLVQESPDAIIATSGDGTVLFWNRAAEINFRLHAAPKPWAELCRR